MPTAQFEDIARKLADLAEQSETSFALRAYLRSAADRVIVDVTNEIDLLARLVSKDAPERRKP